MTTHSSYAPSIPSRTPSSRAAILANNQKFKFSPSPTLDLNNTSSATSSSGSSSSNSAGPSVSSASSSSSFPDNRKQQSFHNRSTSNSPSNHLGSVGSDGRRTIQQGEKGYVAKNKPFVNITNTSNPALQQQQKQIPTSSTPSSSSSTLPPFPNSHFAQNPNSTASTRSGSVDFTPPPAFANSRRRASTTTISNRPSTSNPNVSYNCSGSPSINTQQNVPLLSRKFVARRISEGETGRLKEELKCQACGKGYKHITSLAKHLWEHTPEWSMTSKLLISKHQQVQLLEAASILVSINEPDEIDDEESSPSSGGAAGKSPKQEESVKSSDVDMTITGDARFGNSSQSPVPNSRSQPQASYQAQPFPNLQKQSLVHQHHRNERLSTNSYLQHGVTRAQPVNEPSANSSSSSSSSSSSNLLSTPAFHSVSDQGYLLEQKSSHSPPSSASATGETDSSLARSPCSLVNDMGHTPSPPQPLTPQHRLVSGNSVVNSKSIDTNSNTMSSNSHAFSALSISGPPVVTDMPNDKFNNSANANNTVHSKNTNNSKLSTTTPSNPSFSLGTSSFAGTATSAVGTKKIRNGSKVDTAIPSSTAFQHDYQRSARNRRYSAASVPRGVIRNVLNGGNASPHFNNDTNTLNTSNINNSGNGNGSNNNVNSSSGILNNGQRARRPSALDPPSRITTRPTLDEYSPNTNKPSNTNAVNSNAYAKISSYKNNPQNLSNISSQAPSFSHSSFSNTNVGASHKSNHHTNAKNNTNKFDMPSNAPRSPTSIDKQVGNRFEDDDEEDAVEEDLTTQAAIKNDERVFRGMN